MINQEIARIFDQIADLLEITGGDRFRINSYRRTARILDEYGEDLSAVRRRGELQKITGIGKGTAERIEQYIDSGKIELHQELLAQVPTGLLELLKVPNLGPKKVQVLWQELEVTGPDRLREEIAAGRVAELPRFGARTAEKLLAGLDFMAQASQRTPLGLARKVADPIFEKVAAFDGVHRVEYAGSLRRGCETIGDIDLLCIAEDGGAVVEQFTKLPEVVEVLAAGQTKGSVRVTNPAGGRLQIDLRVVAAESFGAAWQYFTGSKAHNVRMREIAVKKGWKLNEYGLFEGEKSLAGREEKDVYKKFDYAYIPPELREDRGEVEARGQLPELVTLADMRGDLHMHSTGSDGRNTVEQLAEAALERGYEYIAITDHSRSSAIANGMSVDRLLEHVEHIRRVNKKYKNITLLAGVECDILSDGTLDYPDEILAQLDWINASIHFGMQLNRDKLTERTIAAMENPYICAIGHPSGRLIGAREAMDLDWEKVFAAAARTGTALEVNASWQRLDLKDVHVRQAVDAGCHLVISTDAHEITQLDMMSYGVLTARRGWALRERVLNTRGVAELKKWIAGKRSG